ncbi:HAD-IA family hydrolase [Phycicoccus sp. BSK3Z-2]|uniref:HAD-IA family hydrolase n=1 Tax=Phycicoccus avicenniae TaxID=2828860 RepID=A0A941DEA5_9MICO|nr:HAD-IA family hydrolase [Phycicoccus avicenniae]MBR7744732.1 HAD-IA family hydrolase [Phycicoccus avicenniae]
MPPEPAASPPSDPWEDPFARPFAGVLLDMDGTLIDSIAAVERSWGRGCEEYDVDPARLIGFHGVTARGIVARLLPEDRLDEAFARIREIERTDVDDIVVLPGALDLLAGLSAAGVPTAIVTSSTDDLAEARLTATDLPRPTVVVTASDVTRGKPHPDPWLLGARRLGVDPGECLVVEDAVAGLQAARAARCRGLVGLTSTMTAEEVGAEADLVLPDLTALRWRTSAVERSVRVDRPGVQRHG